jgi:hypothetical protein
MTNVPVDQGGENVELPVQQSVDDPNVAEAGAVETEFQRRSREKKEREAAADAEFYSITEQMEPDAAATFNSLYTMAKATRDPAAPVKVASQAATVLTRKGTQAADVDKLKAAYPEDADFIEQYRGQPPNVISGLATQLSGERIAGRKEKKEGGYRIPREGLSPEFANMTDADVSDLMKEQYKAQHEDKGNDVYPRLKGTSLKIMNDDTFKRSGLRTGDTVCIKIP